MFLNINTIQYINSFCPIFPKKDFYHHCRALFPSSSTKTSTPLLLSSTRTTLRTVFIPNILHPLPSSSHRHHLVSFPSRVVFFCLSLLRITSRPKSVSALPAFGGKGRFSVVFASEIVRKRDCLYCLKSGKLWEKLKL